MVNVKKIETNNAMNLPSNYVSVSCDEMEYLDGCGWGKFFTIAFSVVATVGLIALAGGAAAIVFGGAKATILGISALKISAAGSLAMTGGIVGACIASGTPFTME